MKTMPTVTIIVVTYNSAETITLCLDSIFDQTLTLEHVEIVVVDNHSTDETRHIVRQHALPVNLIVLEKNIGFGRANNIALETIKSSYVAFVNPDCELCPDWLGNMINFMQTDEKIAIAGSKIFFSDGRRLQHVGGVVHTNGVTSHIGEGELDVGQYAMPLRYDYVTGVAMFCRRPVIQNVGYFDPRYFMYYEETDLCYQVRAIGADVVYCPTACAIHHEQASFGHSASLNYLYRYHSSRLKFIAKQRHNGLFPYTWTLEFQWWLTPIGRRLRSILVVVYIIFLLDLIGYTIRDSMTKSRDASI